MNWQVVGAAVAGVVVTRVWVWWEQRRARAREYAWELRKPDGSRLQISTGYDTEWIERMAVEQGYEITRRPA